MAHASSFRIVITRSFEFGFGFSVKTFCPFANGMTKSYIWIKCAHRCATDRNHGPYGLDTHTFKNVYDSETGVVENI